MAANCHRYLLRHPCPNHVPNSGSAEIMGDLSNPDILLVAFHLNHLAYSDGFAGFPPGMFEGFKAYTATVTNPTALRPLLLTPLLPDRKHP